MDEKNDSTHEKIIVDQPALFRTAQTTIPILTQIMTGASLALIAISIDVTQNATVLGMNLKDIALIIFSVSALLFWMSTEACIKSQAWDYYFLPKNQREILNLSEDKRYIKSCSEQSIWWYKVAVFLYRMGGICIVTGVIALFYPSNIILIIIIVYLLLVTFIGLLSKIKKKKFLN